MGRANGFIIQWSTALAVIRQRHTRGGGYIIAPPISTKPFPRSVVASDVGVLRVVLPTDSVTSLQMGTSLAVVLLPNTRWWLPALVSRSPPYPDEERITRKNVADILVFGYPSVSRSGGARSLSPLSSTALGRVCRIGTTKTTGERRIGTTKSPREGRVCQDSFIGTTQPPALVQPSVLTQHSVLVKPLDFLRPFDANATGP